MTVPAPSVAAVATLPKRLNAIRHVPLKEYRKKHRYPWIVAYSGGGGSTLLLQGTSNNSPFSGVVDLESG